MTDAEQEAWALCRYRLIRPLLDPALAPVSRGVHPVRSRPSAHTADGGALCPLGP